MDTETENKILQQLHDFGESVLGKKTKKRKHFIQQSVYEEVNEKTLLQRKKNRNRKNRRKRKNELNLADDETQPKPPKHTAIEAIVEMFSLNDKPSSIKNSDENVTYSKVCVPYNEFVEKDISTKTNKKSKNAREETEVFIFKDPKKLKKKKAKPVEEAGEEKVEQTPGNPIFDMDEAKFEVRKLGITGFEESKQERSMVDLLVSLGAKPPKKKYVNYKEFQKQRKDEIIQDKKNKEMDRKLGFRVKKTFNKTEKRDSNDISIRDGQLGRYEHGTQYIRKKDLIQK